MDYFSVSVCVRAILAETGASSVTYSKELFILSTLQRFIVPQGVDLLWQSETF